jgi:CheY-like chemotaxis protein
MSHVAAFIPSECRRIFCVDDDPVTQRIFTVALMRPGWCVECACSGYDAMTRFTSDRRGFDVLVTDHAMPGMSGLELLQRLRERGFDGGAVVVSAHVRPADAAAYRAAGATAVFTKPVDLGALRRAVEQIARRPAAAKAAQEPWSA